MKAARTQFALCASLVGLGLAAPGRLPAQEIAAPDRDSASTVPFAAADTSMQDAVRRALGLADADRQPDTPVAQPVTDAPVPALPVDSPAGASNVPDPVYAAPPVALDAGDAEAPPLRTTVAEPASFAEIRRALGLQDTAHTPVRRDEVLERASGTPQEASRKELTAALLAAVANASLLRHDLLPVPTHEAAEAAARLASIAVPDGRAAAPSAQAALSDPILRSEDPKPEEERRLVPALAVGPSEPKRGEARRTPDWLTVNESWLQGEPDAMDDASRPLPKAVSDAADAAFSEPMAPYASQDQGVASLVQRVVDLAERHEPASIEPAIEAPVALSGDPPVEPIAGEAIAGAPAAPGLANGERVLQALAALRWDELRWRGDVLATPDDAPASSDEPVAHREKVLSTLATLQPEGGARTIESAISVGEPVLADDFSVRPTDELFGDLRAVPDDTVAHEAFADQREAPGGAPVDELFGDLRQAPGDTAVAGVAQTDGGEAVGSGWLALSKSKLDDVRGGFVVDGGLRISFGIERAVYINGNLVTSTRLNVSELGKATAAQGQTSLPATGSLALIQSGAGNTFLTGPMSASSVGTVIQNTLNNQKIQNLTVIDATVNSMQILKSLNLQSALRGAVTDSLRR